MGLVQLLVSGGADVRAVDGKGRTAAEAAAADGAAGMAAWLAEKLWGGGGGSTGSLVDSNA
jgi:hypothetical protein